MLQHFTASLNHFYRDNPPLWDDDFSWNGFSWIAHDDYSQSVIVFRRIDRKGKELIAVCNFTPVQREMYRIGVPAAGTYSEVFTSDAAEFGGTGVLNGTRASEDVPMHGFRAVPLADAAAAVGDLSEAEKAAGAPKRLRKTAAANKVNKTAAPRRQSSAVKEG